MTSTRSLPLNEVEFEDWFEEKEPMTSTRSLPLNEVEFEDWFEEKVRNSPNMAGMDPRLYKLCAKAQYDYLKYWENKKPYLSYLLAMGKRG
ncbi:hypothetical protein Bca52824_026899 [Brassica carinata]|uniref:Uncharacterized protein n=1 Tax=Brassica carinata TaxID=52824 RepID=A0A8X7SIJ0_BRACI|nr:hypothetical protein Bca52824_026899 [Brassica carinata]